MPVNVMAFGSVTDVMGESIQLEHVQDTDALMLELKKRFPALKNSKFLVAVNRKMINKNTRLNGNDTVALMSPFSGG